MDQLELCLSSRASAGPIRSNPAPSGSLNLLVARFSRWIELAKAHAAELMLGPFSKETLRRGVIPEIS